MKQYNGMKTGDHFSEFLPQDFLLHGPGLPASEKNKAKAAGAGAAAAKL